MNRNEVLSERIIAVVLELLESEGHEAVQLREVARRAHVSLSTVYKHFRTRDELIITALGRWMADNCFAAVELPSEDVTLHDGLVRLMSYVFEPWERNPRMLEAYAHVRRTPGGSTLDARSVEALLPAAAALLGGADPRYATDIGLILANMSFAMVVRCADEDLDAADILPILERAVDRLTGDNASPAAAARSGERRSHSVLNPYAAPFRGNLTPRPPR